MTRKILTLLLGGWALFAAGACDDGASGGGGDDPDAAAVTPDAAPPEGDAGGPLPAGSRELQIIGAAQVFAELSTEITLSVRYVGTGMAPVPNGRVSFRLLDAMGNDQSAGGVEGSGLRTYNASTNAQGEAAVAFLAGPRDVTVTVEASANGAAPVRWSVTVGRAGSGGVTAKVLYDPATGRYDYNLLETARVDMFVMQGCEVLRAAAPNLQGAFLSLPDITPFNEIDNQSTTGGLDDGATFTLVATLYNAAGSPVAFGCTENVAITGGQVVTAEITATDLPLEYKGRFTVVNRFDLSGLLRDTGNPTFDKIAQVLDILTILGDGGERGMAVARLFCDLFDAGDGTCNLVERIGGPLINRMFEEVAPQALLDVLTVLGDITSIINELTVVGEIEFINSRTDENGRIEGSDNRWQRFRFTWRRDCPGDCEREFTIGNLDTENRPVAGVFGATVAGETMTIDSHGMNLRYGLILLGLAEQWLIPVITGADGSVAIEDALGSLVPCEWINEQLGDANSGLCEDLLVAALGDVIRDQLGGLNFSPEQFTISGTVKPLDTTGDLKVDTLADGVWQGTVNYGSSSLNFMGCFKGCRDMECPGEPCTIPAR